MFFFFQKKLNDRVPQTLTINCWQSAYSNLARRLYYYFTRIHPSFSHFIFACTLSCFLSCISRSQVGDFVEVLSTTEERRMGQVRFLGYTEFASGQWAVRRVWFARCHAWGNFLNAVALVYFCWRCRVSVRFFFLLAQLPKNCANLLSFICHYTVTMRQRDI